jgi:predicted RND superfamily exporter protein
VNDGLPVLRALGDIGVDESGGGDGSVIQTIIDFVKDSSLLPLVISILLIIGGIIALFKFPIAGVVMIFIGALLLVHIYVCDLLELIGLGPPPAGGMEE